MSEPHDRDYFADRVDQEHEAGDRAVNPHIAAIHYELAFRYALMCGDERNSVLPLNFKRA